MKMIFSIFFFSYNIETKSINRFVQENLRLRLKKKN